MLPLSDQLPNNEEADEIEPIMVTLEFRTDKPDAMLDVLSKYVVLCRSQSGCRNVDLVASMTSPGRFLIVQKWESAEHQATHFDSPTMVEMATACTGLLTQPPDIDLHEAVTMHDLA